MERINDRLPRSLKSIFTPRSPSTSDSAATRQTSPSPDPRPASVDFDAADMDEKVSLWGSHGRSLSQFIKNRSRRSSSGASKVSVPSPTEGSPSSRFSKSDNAQSPTQNVLRNETAVETSPSPTRSPASPRAESGTLASIQPEQSPLGVQEQPLPTTEATPETTTEIAQPSANNSPAQDATSIANEPTGYDVIVPYEAEEVNDVGFDSDNHEEDEDESPSEMPVIPSNSSIRPSMSRQRSKPHSYMEESEAESIIGGGFRRSDVEIENKQEIEVNTKKTFSFSLPFSNPLAGIEVFHIKLPSIFNNESSDNPPATNPQKLHHLKMDVTDRLVRQLSVSSLDEKLVYNDIRTQDNARFRAVKRALTPNITIDILNSRAVPKPNTFPEIEGDVVILGGYRGSILRDAASGRRLWIPIKAGFNLRKIDLTVGPEDQDEYDMIKKVYPDGMLTHIGPVDVSRKLIKKLRSNPKCKVHEFGYDWRLSSDINSERLQAFLKSLPSNKNFKGQGRRRKGAIVLAHSMGGLIAHHAMQQDPTLFRGLLYVGVPSSCPNILGPLRFGDSVLLSSKILTRQVNFLMRSSYVFLPLDGRCFVNRQDTSIKYDIDFFDVNTWIKYKLSPLVTKEYAKESKIESSYVSSFTNFTKGRLRGFSFSTPDGKLPSEPERTTTFALPDQKIMGYEESVEYLDRTLKRTKKFLLELEFDPAKEHLYPPLATLYSHTVPTLRGSKVDNLEGISTDDYTDLLFGAGDGVIYHKWVMPEPKGFQVVGKIAVDRGHVELMSDVDSVGKALEMILEAEKKELQAESSSTPIDSTLSEEKITPHIDVY